MDKGGWIAVIVALITTAGVVASKWLEVAKPEPGKVVAVDPVRPDPVPPVHADPALPDKPVADDPPPRREDPVAAKPATMSGMWTETNSNAIYRFDDNDSGGLTMRGEFGPLIVAAQGGYDAGNVAWNFQSNSGDTGRCQGTIPAPGHVQAMCQNAAGQTYAVIFRRN